MSIVTLTKDTKIGYTKLGAFTRKTAISKPSTAKEAPYEGGNIEYKEQLKLIYKIYNSFELVNVQGEKGLKYLSDTNDLLIEREYKSFRCLKIHSLKENMRL